LNMEVKFPGAAEKRGAELEANRKEHSETL
jgi:hypothetical protein